MAFLQHHLQLQQQEPKPPFRNMMTVDGQIFFSPQNFADPQYSSFHVAGLAPATVPAAENAIDLKWNNCEQKKKKLKEHEFLENSQISSVDFLQTRSVSTGLGLSLDDRKVASSFGESPLISLLDEDIDREIQRQEVEIDRFVKLQGERLRHAILKKLQASQLQTLSTAEERIFQKLREKEAEVEDINRKNTSLEERMKQLSVEAGAWQHRAKCNENMIAALKFNLQQVVAQSRDSKEGCGDSEVDDTASCCNGGPTIDFHLLVNKDNKDMKEMMTCKACRVNEVCMLLLPCRHLCLCKDCENKLSLCPLCQSSKFIGMEVYM